MRKQKIKKMLQKKLVFNEPQEMATWDRNDKLDGK